MVNHPRTFRKKPVIIEAVQWDGTAECANAIAFWAQDYGVEIRIHRVDDSVWLRVETLEGLMDGSVDDWIIKGVKDEFYPCKPDIFAATYEHADSQKAPTHMPGMYGLGR